MLDPTRFRLMRLEDGELVIRLCGARHPSLKSNRPHAGIWSPSTAYLLVPCTSRRSCSLRISSALQSCVGLLDRSSEVEVLLLGTPEQITSLILSGPRWARAQKKRASHPAPQLVQYQFKPRQLPENVP